MDRVDDHVVAGIGDPGEVGGDGMASRGGRELGAGHLPVLYSNDAGGGQDGNVGPRVLVGPRTAAKAGSATLVDLAADRIARLGVLVAVFGQCVGASGHRLDLEGGHPGPTTHITPIGRHLPRHH